MLPSLPFRLLSSLESWFSMRGIAGSSFSMYFTCLYLGVQLSTVGSSGHSGFQVGLTCFISLSAINVGPISHNIRAGAFLFGDVQVRSFVFCTPQAERSSISNQCAHPWEHAVFLCVGKIIQNPPGLSDWLFYAQRCLSSHFQQSDDSRESLKFIVWCYDPQSICIWRVQHVFPGSASGMSTRLDMRKRWISSHFITVHSTEQWVL